MKVDLLEKQNIEQLQKQLKKHSLLILLLSLFIVGDFLVGFIFQTRETQGIFIIACSIILWICLSLILFIVFVFIAPERKYLKMLLNAENSIMTTLKGAIINELTSSYEDGFKVRKYEFKVEESQNPIIIKIEASQVPCLEIDKKYLLKVSSHFVVGYEEIL